jgi:uncharacterized protein (DUF2141 family)
MIVLMVAAAAPPLSPITVVAQQSRDTRRLPAASAPAGTGIIAGAVTSEDGSRPVRFAYLVLIGVGTGFVKVSATDADGRFAFANLPADRYTLGASKPPYLGTVAGARRPGRSGTPIALADGQKIANVAIRMPLGAAISGVIVDEKGQPASGVMVTLQQWRMQGGERRLESAGSAGADERGRYRFFGLQPGEYVVAGMRFGVPEGARSLTVTEVDAALKGGPVSATQATASTIRYAPVYFPGTTRVTEAMPIAVATGDERANVDFRLELVQTAKVEGAVMTSDGQIVTAGSVMLRTVGTSPLQSATTVRITPDGRFSFSNVSPGMYALTMFGGPGPTANQYALTPVEVNGVDVLGAQLILKPLLTMSGRLEFRGGGVVPALAGRRIPVRALAAMEGMPGPNVTATTDTGMFTMTNVSPGAYLIGAPLSFGPTTDSMTWALESVIADGRDITDLPFEITPESVPKDLVITFSDRFQELGGRLGRADGAPVSEYTIIVFPQDKAYWVTGSRRIVTTRPGTDGRFSLSGPGPTTLPAGKYYLAAVTDIDRNEQFDPAFLASIVPAAAQITLQPGEKKTQDLIVR